jgi:ribosomal 50S subunit-recycling heat shock protein
VRLDKFLKVARLAKRRSEAHGALVAGRVTKPDGRVLKPGYAVAVDDVLVIHYATKYLTVRVLLVPERVTPALHRTPMYAILDERRDEPADWLDA